MKKGYQFILYFLVLALIVAGILAIIFAQALLGYLRAGNILTPATTPAATVAAADTLDPTVLQAPTVKSLINHVLNFNFDNICYRPDTFNVVAVPATTPPDQTGGAEIVTAPVGCRLGSSLPFVIKTK